MQDYIYKLSIYTFYSIGPSVSVFSASFLPLKLSSLSLIISYPFVGSDGPKQSHNTKNTIKQPITECTIVMNKITANFKGCTRAGDGGGV